MSRVAFKQCDVQRALKAAKAAGVPVRVRYEKATGDLLIEPVDGPGPAPQPDDAADFWKSWNADQGRA